MKNSLAKFARLVQSLRDLLEAVYATAGDRKKIDASKVWLDDLWKEEHTHAFQRMSKPSAFFFFFFFFFFCRCVPG